MGDVCTFEQNISSTLFYRSESSEWITYLIESGTVCYFLLIFTDIYLLLIFTDIYLLLINCSK